MDKLFEFEVDQEKCPQCNKAKDRLYILAENFREAEKIRTQGGGLCGDCQCENIIMTHGAIITAPDILQN